MLYEVITYLTTGNPRFLGIFEREMTAYVDNTYGPASKFGQHPAGFYLEEYGPDGNYDHLNFYCVCVCYYFYRDMKNANRITSYNVCYTKLLRYRHLRDIDWIVASSAYKDEIFYPLQRLRMVIYGSDIFLILVAGTLAFFLSKRITRPLEHVITSYSIHYTKLYEL